MNLLWLGVGCLGGVVLYLASDQLILLVLGVLVGVALGIGFGSESGE